MRSYIIASGLVASAVAFTQPTDATWGPLTQPDLTHPVTQGQTFTVTWDPEGHETEGVTVSLVLCQGPSNNCKTASNAIVEGVPADAKSYDWAVPCELPVGEASTETGYGMLIIVDGTGEFQYSTQFSVEAGECGSSSSASASASYGGQGAGSWTTKGWDSSYPSNATATSVSTYSHSGYDTSSIVYATPTPEATTIAATTSDIPTFSFGAESQAASDFTGAAAQPTGNVGNVFGMVAAGGLALLAL